MIACAVRPSVPSRFWSVARARDGMAWRYAPGAPAGDTSILGWVVMGLKSAKEVGIPIPGEPVGPPRHAALAGEGRDRSVQGPGPLSTLGAGHSDHDRRGLGLPPVPRRRRARPASSEAAEFLLQNESDRGKTNVYYWYYATLALYQHGGEPWTKWNAKIRDRIVGLQSTVGPPDRKLGARRQPLRSQGGPDLLHDPGGPFARGLLPLLAALRRTQDPARSRRKPGAAARRTPDGPFLTDRRRAVAENRERAAMLDRRTAPIDGSVERDRRSGSPRRVDFVRRKAITSQPGPFRSRR